jgi:hypothetical protein
MDIAHHIILQPEIIYGWSLLFYNISILQMTYHNWSLMHTNKQNKLCGL